MLGLIAVPDRFSWLEMKMHRVVVPGLGFLLLVGLTATTRGVHAAESAPRPNIVFILFDDMGYGQPSCYRADSEFKTPNLDRLAREGMRFTDAHTAASVCTPTRYGVLTGRYPWRIGQYGVLETYSPPIIERDRLTVGRLLQQHGYHTACVGKWHLGMTWEAKLKGVKVPATGTTTTEGPTARGFDSFCGFTHARNIGMILEQDKVSAQLGAVEVQPFLAKKAVAYIDERARENKPFFLYLPLCTPHTPIVPAPEFVGKSGAQTYGDWLYEGDWVTGQVLQALERQRLTDNTLVIATSDNGAAGRAYAPLRGSKASIYEGGHRVPFLARWPGKIRPGAVCDDTVCLNDLLATCADLLNVKLPDNAGEDSVSILPALLGTAAKPVRDATVHQSPSGELAIRQGTWKLIFARTGRELYDLATDLGETRNRAADRPELVEQLTQRMRQIIDQGRSTPGAPQKNAVTVNLTRPQKGKGAKKALNPNLN